MGKLSCRDLNKLLSCIRKDSRVVVPPMVGFDSGAHLINDDTCLVISTDPCTGVPQKLFGWLLVNYAASDVALFGARPEFCTINLLGPHSTAAETFRKVMTDVCAAANELDMAIVTGHTGTYDSVRALLGVCTAYGMVDRKRLITPGGAKSGDGVLCVRPIGLETTVNMALARERIAKSIYGARHAMEMQKLAKNQSCVREAMLLSRVEGVHAMHDATEGGLLVALNEVAEASKVGFKVEFEKVPVFHGAQKLQEVFKLSTEQVLSMSSTGTIIASVDPKTRITVEKKLAQNGIEASFIGFFTKDTHRVLIEGNKESQFPRDADDPYTRILSGKL